PGLVCQLGAAAAGIGHRLPRLDVLGHQPERPVVVVGLRHPAPVSAIGGDAATIGEHHLLPGRAVARQEGIADAFLVAAGSGQAEAQAGQGAVAALPGFEEEPSLHLGQSIRIAGTGAAAIGGAVEDVREAAWWWMLEYNEQRPHDSLGDMTPAEVRQQYEESSTFALCA